MIDLNKLRAMGEPWCIWRGFAVDQVLAAPRTSVRLPAGIGGGPKPLSSERIVILGFAYDYVAANGNGFDLVSRSAIVSPSAVSTADLVIWSSRATTAQTQVALCVPECFIPLDAGSSSPFLQTGAQLVLDVTATPPTSGQILIWGVTMPGNEGLLTNRYFGSPFNLAAIPPTTP